MPLPIEPILPAIRDALRDARHVVVQAPPGAGKTTMVPLALLDEPWLGGQSIVMLEPRRVATRAAAWRLAELRGENVGQTVGYRMRGESRVGRETRVEVVTEGVLTRRLQRDPTLEGVGVLVFDEFHERSVDADLGLALALRTRELLRDDLRIVVMSATLDGESVARMLGGAPVLTSHGRAFPVETRYYEPRRDARIEATVANAIADALTGEQGDILAFLPGAGEIRRVQELLAERFSAPSGPPVHASTGPPAVLPLYGLLDRESQDRALFPDPGGRRKIVLSTSIAETSLTIEGIQVVIDAGLSRVPRFSPRTGMARLETVRVSKSSAEQRRGRAGRTAPGVCYRLWSEHETLNLLDQTPPEILHADLAPLALDLAAAGVSDPSELAWLDAPPAAAYAQARELLAELDALDSRGAATSHGRRMASLGVHPRLAHMLLRSRDSGDARLAADVAALLSERDVIRSEGGTPDVDLSLRVDVLRGGSRAPVDRDALHRAGRESQRLVTQLDKVAGRNAPSEGSATVGSLAALAYPDRVARRRSGSRPRFVLRNGRGAELRETDALAPAEFIVAIQLDDRKPEAQIFLAAGMSGDEVRRLLADQIQTEDTVEFDQASESVVARRAERLGAIVLRESTIADADAGRIRATLIAELRRRGVSALPWSDAATRLRKRLAFVAAHETDWPDVSDDALGSRLDHWLGPLLDGVRRIGALNRLDLSEALLSLLDWRKRRELDDLAPTHVVVPTGSRIPVDYSDAASPAVAVRLQEVFGLTESPRVLGGRIPVTMQLLSPAHRPVQTTRDLAGFWRTSYFDVRKDLRGRYPRHEWPEDPLGATPTKRAKPRK